MEHICGTLNTARPWTFRISRQSRILSVKNGSLAIMRRRYTVNGATGSNVLGTSTRDTPTGALGGAPETLPDNRNDMRRQLNVMMIDHTARRSFQGAIIHQFRSASLTTRAIPRRIFLEPIAM